ncbi:hypothetical protein [Krasilnikovia sp. MM14-A1004]|uniref:hypothetical protein n=1 Tax=Krasilnikovia sp. MM14-A1004 TaxID=3373541 RepID=UPI00399D4A1E
MTNVATVQVNAGSAKAAVAQEALRDALRLVETEPEPMARTLRALCLHPNAGVAADARKATRARMAALVRTAPEAARAVQAAFADADPDLREPVVQAAAEAGDLSHVDLLTDAPEFYLAWLHDDPGRLRTGLTGLPDAEQRRAAFGTLWRLALAWLTPPSTVATGRDPQPTADAVAGFAADDDLDVRSIAVAVLARCGEAGADLSKAVPALCTALADERRTAPQHAVVRTWWPKATVTWLTGRALGFAATHPGSRAAALDTLATGLQSRRKPVRDAAARGLGVACHSVGDAGPLAPVLATGAEPLLTAAFAALKLVDHGASAVPPMVDAVVNAGLDPAWCFPDADTYQLLAPHLRIRTRRGLGLVLDMLVDERRPQALTGLGAALRAGDPVAAAVPLIAGAMLCGDWPVWPKLPLGALADAAAGGVPVAAVRRWAVGRDGPEAAAFLTASGPAGDDTHPEPGGAAHALPFPGEPAPPVPALPPVDELAPQLRRGRTAATDQRIRAVSAPLWSTAAAADRCRVLDLLRGLARDMVDVRAAQPAVTVSFADPDPEVRRLAAGFTRERAGQGADIRLALPGLVLLCDDPDPRVRRTVWEALVVADQRHHPLLSRIADTAARAAGTDPDPEVRDCATTVLDRTRSAAAPP